MVRFNNILTTLTTSIKKYFRGTLVADFYYSNLIKYIRGITTPLATYDIQSPIGSIQMELPSGSWFEKVEHDPNGYEPGLVYALSGCLDNGSLFYEVGAGFGWFANVALTTGVPPENIHLFEPDPYRFPILKRNVPNEVFLTQAFVGAGMGGTKSIDEYCSTHPCPDVVLIDVEGKEAEVVRGMSSTLEYVSHVFIELHPGKLGNEELEDIKDILSKRGFRQRTLNHRQSKNEWYTLDDDLPLDHSTPSPTCLLYGDRC